MAAGPIVLPILRSLTNMDSSSSSSNIDMLRVLNAAVAAATAEHDNNVDVPSLTNKHRGGSKPGKTTNSDFASKAKVNNSIRNFLLLPSRFSSIDRKNVNKGFACLDECTRKSNLNYCARVFSFTRNSTRQSNLVKLRIFRFILLSR